MTEKKWRDSKDLIALLEFLRKASTERKLRLYFCAGCRCIMHLFFRPESLTAVEVADCFADGDVTSEELELAEWNAEAVTFGLDLDEEKFSRSSPYSHQVIPRLVELGALPETVLSGGEWIVNPSVRRRLLAAAELAEYSAISDLKQFDWGQSYIALVDWPSRWLFDCVFGNPFRPATINFSWLNPIVTALARTAYEHRCLPEGTLDPDCLCILADALEDAGCDNADILNHLRGSGPHTRGCWPLDLILGRV